MRHPKSNQTGSSGNLAVMKKFVDIGWNPIPVPQEHDVGTDLLIIVSDSRLFDMGGRRSNQGHLNSKIRLRAAGFLWL